MLDQKRIIELQESTGHSVFGPSSMKRIMLCPGSVLAQLGVPPKPSSVHAEKGTYLHECCEEAVTTVGLDQAVEYAWKSKWDWEDKLLVVSALQYVQDVAALHEGPYELQLEAKGTLAGWGMPEVYGTMDVQIISATRVDVLDYKFGHGIQVFAKKNPQCACYLGGSVPFNGGIEPMQELHVHIVQPTKEHYDDWHVGWAELTAILLGDIQDALKKAKTPNPDYAPSEEACRWCDANLKCKHRMKKVRTSASDVLKASKDPNSVTQAQWKEILDNRKFLKKAIEDAVELADTEISAGREFAGYKHIKGRNARFFEDQEKGDALIKNRLGAKAFKQTILPLVTLAQAEKLDPSLKKYKPWKDMILKKSGKPALVPVSDPREAIVYGIESDFSDVAEEMNQVKTTSFELGFNAADAKAASPTDVAEATARVGGTISNL